MDKLPVWASTIKIASSELVFIEFIKAVHFLITSFQVCSDYKSENYSRNFCVTANHAYLFGARWLFH